MPAWRSSSEPSWILVVDASLLYEHKRGGTSAWVALDSMSSYGGVMICLLRVPESMCYVSSPFCSRLGKGVVYHRGVEVVCCLPLGDVSCWLCVFVAFSALYRPSWPSSTTTSL
jgi:hypothetical protein